MMKAAISKNLLFLCFLILILFMVPNTNSQPKFTSHQCPNTTNIHTTNTTYNQNLHTLLSSLPSNIQTNVWFYNLTAGREPDKANVLALCQGDLSVEKCRTCVGDAARQIVQDCPNQKDAIGWYDNCMVRYSNESIPTTGDRDLLPSIINGVNAADAEGFSRALRTLLDRLKTEAASGNSTLKFAVGQIDAPNFDTIFGLLQCIPIVNYIDCYNCLAQAASDLHTPSASVGARVFVTSCSLRYETYLFFDSPSTPPPRLRSPPPPTPSRISSSKTPGSNVNSTTIIIIIVVSVISSVVILVSVIYFILRFRNRKYRIPSEEVQNSSQEATDEISNMEMIQFDFETIKEATNGFSNENKLGRGGFGAVYKGELVNGRNIAVKRLSRESSQGDVEFKNEVLVVAKLHHRNLVRLLGFCTEGNERLLIFEFLPNASLDHFLIDLVKRTFLNWESRYKIINGIARGLLYLHEDSRVRIIHRDLKASNILLDEKMNPKIADFGIARSFELDETRGQTNRIVGTFGYMAPEYAYHGQFSTKSDVFSFGVLMLEIISGQRNNDFSDGENPENLLSFAWKKLREGTPENVIDPVLGSGSRAEIIRCIHIGLLCVQENAGNRPTMSSVVLMLNSISFILPKPSRPGFFLQSNDMSSNDRNRYSPAAPVEASQNVASISELYPR